jgi:hypothetical protein
MLRTICACAATAAACFGISAATGFASRSDTVTVRVGDTAHFPIADVTCVPQRRSGIQRYSGPGVACSSPTSGRAGVRVWFSSRYVTVTRPPSTRAIFRLPR